jgi:hypothetical protein
MFLGDIDSQIQIGLIKFFINEICIVRKLYTMRGILKKKWIHLIKEDYARNRIKQFVLDKLNMNYKKTESLEE